MQKMQEMHVQSLGREDPLQEEMATYSSILAWKILWSEEPGKATVHEVTELHTTGHACTTTAREFTLEPHLHSKETVFA